MQVCSYTLCCPYIEFSDFKYQEKLRYNVKHSRLVGAKVFPLKLYNPLLVVARVTINIFAPHKSNICFSLYNKIYLGFPRINSINLEIPMKVYICFPETNISNSFFNRAVDAFIPTLHCQGQFSFLLLNRFAFQLIFIILDVKLSCNRAFRLLCWDPQKSNHCQSKFL